MQPVGLPFLLQQIRRRDDSYTAVPKIIRAENELTLGASVRVGVAGVELRFTANAGDDHFGIGPQGGFRLLPGT
jgi:hypothetical protein